MKSISCMLLVIALASCALPQEQQQPNLQTQAWNTARSTCWAKIKNPEKNPKKVNECAQKVYDKEIKTLSIQLAERTGAGELCYSWYNRQATVDMAIVDNEVKKRGLNCAQIIQNTQMMQQQAQTNYLQHLSTQQLPRAQFYPIKTQPPINNNFRCRSYSVGNQVYTDCN